ncbi:hypothetical protein AMK59_3876 [Oryctes borbonicus]|uniref:Uncharacterized protein n=1 Tax=Oryctes borbonicus TaxID=1629725 RepID=A0A0T6B849_9SCAR|nr:hypothetical protein AMK59_3876 [Oryctes borbonicus]
MKIAEHQLFVEYNNYNQLLQPEVLKKILMKYLNVTSCANSVIDHKIEQAMDMVKTHLMHSMRAEVESLRAKITELLERIHQLEIENDFLKSNAAPEVLIALNNGAAKMRSNEQGIN